MKLQKNKPNQTKSKHLEEEEIYILTDITKKYLQEILVTAAHKFQRIYLKFP